MLRAALYFLIGALVLVVVLYIARLIIGMLGLPADIAQIAVIILGLIGLVALVYLVVRVARGGADPFA